MNSFSSDRLYKLLPAIYRLRDTASGESLRALLALIEQELLTIEDNISDLYDNWFIETCAEWVVPYIGDLLDVNQFYADISQVYGQQERRAYVANTIAYRRRKGTTSVLEQLTQDVTGWRSRAVEFARLIATTQNLNHIRSNSTTANLRANNQLQEIGTPFEQQAIYIADIRSANQGGRYNIANIGLFIYRLQSYPIERSTARPVFRSETQLTGRYYTFNPLGYKNIPLFNQPQTKTDILTLSEEINLPGILRRAPLANELKQRRQSLLLGKSLSGIRYFDNNPVLQIFINGKPHPIAPEEILICNLESENEDGSWIIPTQEFEYNNDDFLLRTKAVAVDPELGRIAFLNEPFPQRVEVSYFYGFSDDIGGGSYSRNNVITNDLVRSYLSNNKLKHPLFWEVKQGTSADENPLETAIATWNQTVEVWQGIKELTHIPLADIVIPTVEVINLDRGKNRPLFSPGIISGLRVIVRSQCLSIIVTSGRAVDRQGRLIILEKDYIINLKNLKKLNLTQDAKGWLVIFYRSSSEKQIDRPPIEFISESSFEEYPSGTFIPLIHLTFNSGKSKPQFNESNCRSFRFQPGIVQGLEVKLQPGKLEAVITAGKVVDERGRSLTIPNNFSVDLTPYQGKSKYLVLRKTTNFTRIKWQIQLWNQEDFPDSNFEPNCFKLAILHIPQVQINKNQLTDRKTNDNFEVKGLNVTLVNPDRAIIAISPGTVSNKQGETIILDREIKFDFSAYSGQKLILFISYQTNQGLPLTPVNPKGRGWQYLGIVPQETDTKTGTILITDNCTYKGDLSIIVPDEKHLQIIAADGCRPHLQGNLSVRGITIAKDPKPGELTLNGLLVEGKITVLAGNLKSLNIKHCTLVPEQGGLYVEPGWLAPLNINYGEGFDAIALVMYSLNWVWQSICRDVGLSNTSPEFNPTQLLQPTLQQLQNRVSQIWQTLQRWRCLQELEPDTEEEITTTQWDNACLEITIDRTICGPISLNNTVPKLSIIDSIIDKGSTKPEQQEPQAILAPGSEVEIKTTTIFGMTTVRNLEASNSLFTEKVIVLRHQNGCIRFSYLPEASYTPRRYQCQPDTALQIALKRVPTAVTAIETFPNSDPNSENFFVFLGTAGDGVFRLNNQNNQEQWKEVTPNLSNRYITALLVSDRTPSQTNTIWMGAVDSSIYCSRNNGENWTTIKTGLNTPINHLVAWRKANTILEVNEAVKNNLTAQTFETHLLVATLGEGIICGNDRGENWEKINTGLTNLNVTALAIDSRGQLFAGTSGGGVFQFSSNKNQSQTKSPRWIPLNTGLTNLYITSLTIDSNGKLWAGTTGSGIFCSTLDETGWTEINQGLTSFDITTIVTIKITETMLVFAGTAKGEIFRLFDNGEKWQKLNLNSQGVDITALTVNQNNKDIFAGMASGNILRSRDGGESWISITQGLPNIAEKLLIMERLQPKFTSTNYGNPSYAQLSQTTAEEIRTGAENEAEIGVFNSLKQPQKEANLRASIQEHLRFGLKAGIFYIN